MVGLGGQSVRKDNPNHHGCKCSKGQELLRRRIRLHQLCREMAKRVRYSEFRWKNPNYHRSRENTPRTAFRNLPQPVQRL